MSEESEIWGCLTFANEISALTENPENESFKEIGITISKAKLKLVSFLLQKFNDAAFDLCLQSIKELLIRMKTMISSLDVGVNREEIILQLLRLDLVLSYRVDQIDCLFHVPQEGNQNSVPKGAEIIIDRAAKIFWTTSFGAETLMVPWNCFFPVFTTFLNLKLSVEETILLCNFLDFTRDGYVSTFEFNYFIQWFGPLTHSFSYLSRAYTDGILSGFIPAFEADLRLKDKPSGTFLIRFSKSKIENFALAFVASDAKVKHSLITTKSPFGIEVQSSSCPRGGSYNNISDFVNAHAAKLSNPSKFSWLGSSEDHPQSNSALPQSEGEQSAKKNSIFSPPVEMSKDQAGDDGGCVVCMDNPVQTVFLECGHVSCCKECAPKLKRCPICRSVIDRWIPIFR